jgi:hypothetical protein
VPVQRLLFRRVCKIAESDYELCYFCLSASKNTALTGGIFMKFDISGFFENLSKIQVSLQSDKNNGLFT